MRKLNLPFVLQLFKISLHWLTWISYPNRHNWFMWRPKLCKHTFTLQTHSTIPRNESNRFTNKSDTDSNLKVMVHDYALSRRKKLFFLQLIVNRVYENIIPYKYTLFQFSISISVSKIIQHCWNLFRPNSNSWPIGTRK